MFSSSIELNSECPISLIHLKKITLTVLWLLCMKHLGVQKLESQTPSFKIAKQMTRNNHLKQ